MSEENKTKTPRRRPDYKGAWKWRPVADKMKVGDMQGVESLSAARALRKTLLKRGKRCRFETVEKGGAVMVHCIEPKKAGRIVKRCRKAGSPVRRGLDGEMKNPEPRK